MSGVQVSPFHDGDRMLAGFVLSGRWPESTREWTHFLALAVRVAAIPGMLNTTTVFRALEDRPETEIEDAVGIVVCAGPVLGERAPLAGAFAEPFPTALMLLHPPDETVPSTPENAGAASGALLLPGVPHLGLEHRAGWAEADSDGTITKLLSRVGVLPTEDPDIAVLATLCAA